MPSTYLLFSLIIFSTLFLQSLTSPPPPPPSSQLSTLMSLKASLDPTDQILTSWTTPSTNPCDGSFEGVTCNGHGYVTSISLQGKGLTGKIPGSISGLTNLTGLYLHFNALTGDIPKEIGSLSLLTDLYLNVNNLSGDVPPDIAKMSNLQVVQLCYNKLNGSIPTQLGSLKKLSVLALQYNHLTGAIPASLGDLSMLTRLDISFNNLFGPIPVRLATMPSLQVFDIRNNSLTGNVPPAFRRLNDGFQYENNPGLCGIGFPNLELCPAKYHPDRPEPLGPDDLSNKNIPESVDLKPDCGKTKCSNVPRAHHNVFIWGIVGAMVSMTVIGLFSFAWYRRKKQNIESSLWSLDNRFNANSVQEVSRTSASPLINLEYSNGWDPLAKGGGGSALSQEVFDSFMFNLEDVDRATQSFSEVNLLGKNNFSATYQGILRDGSVVAVKRIAKTSCKPDEEEIVNGLKLLTLLRHENLVRLRGFCCSKGRGECFLIYEFVPNGNLLQYLDVEHDCGKVLEWSTRVSIIHGIAEGIGYIHGSQGKKLPIVHQNISAEKVFLDHWCNPLLSDSGIHKLLADDILFSMLKESAAMGYLAPEYISTGRFTEKSDVYAFGMLMFQIISGKRLITPIIQKGAEACQFEDFVDSNLGGNFSEQEAAKLAKIALLCTHDSPNLRPSMEDVMRELSS